VTDGKIKLKATKLPDQITAICCTACSRVSERPRVMGTLAPLANGRRSRNEVSTMDKAVNKALDRLRRPDARLVLTYVNDGSSVTGRAYFIMPGGHRVMDQTAQQLLERGDVQPFDSGLLPGHPQSWKLGNWRTWSDDHGAA
jgi:hypothetical protein